MPSIELLKLRQKYPLELKIAMTLLRIRNWYEHWQGDVYISFSGGKDSTVLLDLVRSIYPEVPAVFVDTGLEFPEIREFVKQTENVIIRKPEMNFRKVVEKYGWNFPSKDVASMIWYGRKGSKWAIDRLNGLNPDGTESEFKKTRYSKWKYLLDAPFIISNQCCIVMKETPLHKYEKETGRKAFIATMAEESLRRQQGWERTGCNAFDLDRPSSKPLSFWTNQDVLHYIVQKDLPYAKVYGKIEPKDKQVSFDFISTELRTTGEERTGCIFCPTGCHLDSPNKYERLKTTHPDRYKYCIEGGQFNSEGMWIPTKDGLGLAKVLDYLGVTY